MADEGSEAPHRRLAYMPALDGVRAFAVLGVMVFVPGDGNQVDAKTFVDQKPHDTAMSASRRRARCTGLLSCQGCLRGRPRKG